jgi:hypothetical protein
MAALQKEPPEAQRVGVLWRIGVGRVPACRRAERVLRCGGGCGGGRRACRWLLRTPNLELARPVDTYACTCSAPACTLTAALAAALPQTRKAVGRASPDRHRRLMRAVQATPAVAQHVTFRKHLLSKPATAATAQLHRESRGNSANSVAESWARGPRRRRQPVARAGCFSGRAPPGRRRG